MAGIVKVNRTTGRLCLNSKSQATSCGCKCGAHCNIGTAAKSYTLTSTGITLGACNCIGTAASIICGTSNAQSVKIDRMPTASFNGTFTLDTYNEVAGVVTTEACQWIGGTVDTMDFSIWGNSSCGSFNVASVTNALVSWELVRLYTTWRLLLQVLPATQPPNYCLPPRLFFADLSATEPEDCSGILTFTNEIMTACQIQTLSDGEVVSSIASGGTVVCTPNF